MPSLKKLCLKVTRWLFTIKLLPILFFSSAVTRDNSYNCKAIHGWQFPMSKSTMTARNLAPQRCMEPTDIETFSSYNKHHDYSVKNELSARFNAALHRWTQNLQDAVIRCFSVLPPDHRGLQNLRNCNIHSTTVTSQHFRQKIYCFLLTRIRPTFYCRHYIKFEEDIKRKISITAYVPFLDIFAVKIQLICFGCEVSFPPSLHFSVLTSKIKFFSLRCQLP